MEKFMREIEVKTPSTEERVFQLECEVSMLTEFVNQLVGQLRSAGLDVSEHLEQNDGDFE